MELATKRLKLRDYTLNDAQALENALTNPFIAQYVFSAHKRYSISDAEEWISFCIKESQKNPRLIYSLGIELQRSSGIIGEASLFLTNRKRKTAELGYFLCEEFWKQGIMTEALNRLVEFSFDELKINELLIRTSVNNPDSNRLARRIGFLYQRAEPQIIFSDIVGNFPDMNIYTLKSK
ncbi:MAG: GNAT family N-acetyltransferase [Candidatus Pacearchaeota archaeon]|jgi:ribosomal-protein-alanine N-acetyltransferase